MQLFKTKNKKAQTGGLITGLVFGVAALVIGVIVALVITSTLSDAGFFSTSSAEQNATDELRSNFTTGISNVSNKIPTVLLIAAIVLILGVLAVLVGVWQRMRMGGGSL